MSRWSSIAIGDALVKRSGTVDPSRFPDEVFDLYSVPAYERGVPDVVRGESIGSSKQIVQPGDVLLCRIVPHIRRAWIVGPARGRRIIASGEWMVFRSKVFEPTWLRHVFLADRFHGQMMQTVAGVGGSLMRARPSHVSNIEVLLPPLDEQRRIAATLDQADALRAKRREMIADFERLTEALFTDLFGDPIDGGSSLLGDIADIQIGPFGSLLHREDYVESGVPLVNPMHIVGGMIFADPAFSVTPEKARSLTDYRLRAGDVIMGRRGEMGRCAVVAREHEGYLCGTGSLILRPRSDRSVGGYLQAALSHPRARAMLKRVALGSTLPNLNATIVKRLPISAPNLAEQEHFVAISSQIAAVRGHQSSALSAHDALFASLQSRAFRGEL